MKLRKDVLPKVTGRAVYANDIVLPGMVYAKVVRSTIPSGRIRSIDASAALEMPGVLRVFTAGDIPGIPSQPRERPVLCPDRVRCVGDGVALVVAESPEEAAAAAAAVRVDLEPLPALLDAERALDEDAPLVHETGNRIARYVTVRGDAETALAAAPHVLRRRYTTPRVQHVCIETEAAVASYDPGTGETLVRCPVNSPFPIRKVVSETLGCPMTDVRVVLTTIGASFGGKNYDIALAASRAAMASRLLCRPCKLVLNREESIEEGTKRHPLFADYTVGFDGEGKLLAMKIRLTLDGGAYTSKTFPVTSRMAIEGTGPYQVPHVDTEAVSVYTNQVYSDALRGFGSPQVDFCSESLMDEIAAYLGKDPVAVRRLNMLEDGKPSAFGQIMEDVTLPQCLEALEEAVDFPARRERIAAYNASHSRSKKGLGVALLHRGESFGAAGQGIDTASGMLSIQPDGSVSVCSSIAEVGQGGSSMVASVVHEALGISWEKIRYSGVDTTFLTDAGPTVATRGTVFSGGAVYRAAGQLREKLTAYAEPYLHTREVTFENGEIFESGNPDNRVPLQKVIGDVFAASDHLNALGYMAAPPLPYDKSCGVGDAYLSYVYGAAAAEVTVDVRTGVVSVDEYFAVHDVGHAFDKAEAEGQIRGGVCMGVGYAVMEELEMSEGRIQNHNLDSYIIPTALDMPKTTPIVLEIPGRYGPFGAKGLGEPATCIVAPAIVNAVADAAGRRVRDLPANLEQVALGHKVKKK